LLVATNLGIVFSFPIVLKTKTGFTNHNQ